MKGWDRSHVTRLKARGRIVLNDDNLVDVDATEKRLAETEGAIRPDVADRHAHERGKGAAADGAEDDVGAHGINSSNAGRMKLYFEALRAEREHAEACKELVDRKAYNEALANAIAVFRVRMDAMPDQLTASILVEREEARIKTLLTDYKDDLLAELAAAFAKIEKEAGHVA